VSASSDRKVKNWERTATVAARYTIAARKMGEGYRDAVLEGSNTFYGAVEMDDSVETILEREVKEEQRAEARHKTWRRTLPPGRDIAKELNL
jgi:hypothetical protein